MKRERIRRAMTLALVALALGCLPACEENDDVRNPEGGPVEGLVIEPAVAEATLARPVTLTVSGGLAPYTWTVDSATLGAVTPNAVRTGIATYRATAVGGTSIVRVFDSHDPPWMATVMILQ